MTDERKISLAIPTYQRVSMTIESFIDVHDDERISEIVIVDDASDNEIYEELKSIVHVFHKVKLFRNIFNKDCYSNKATAISYTNNPFSILLDSDNKINKYYIDKIFEIKEWHPDTIYTPEAAEPNFMFVDYSGLLITKENVHEYIDKPLFETLLNAANYFVNRDEYLEVWQHKINPVTSDSIFVCMKWLEKGNKIQVVEGLRYFHRVHNGSHYQNEKHRTPNGFHESILNSLRQMV